MMKPRIGIYIFNGAEVVDWAAPFGVMAVARRLDPEIDVFLISDSGGTVTATGNLAVMPRYSLDQYPTMTAFIIPGGIGTRTEIHNERLLQFIRKLPEHCFACSICTGSWVLGRAGLLDGIPATSRKEADPSEPMTPLDRLKIYAPAVELSRARVVDTGKVITAGGISSGLILDLLSRLYTGVGATQFATIDTLLQGILIISDLAFLTAISYVIYTRPREKTFKDRVYALLTLRLWPHGILLFSYMGYLLFAIIYLVFDAPYTVSNLSTLGGVHVTTLEYNYDTVIILIIVIAIFVVYPSAQIFVAARQTRNRFVGRTLQGYGLSWIVIGAEIFLFNGYLINKGIDLREIGYLVSAAAFSLSAVIFRKVSILEEFFLATRNKSRTPNSSNPFSSRIVAMPSVAERQHAALVAEDLKIADIIDGKAILLEMDASTTYEELIRDFALESISSGYSVLAFTANGSRIHKTLSVLPDIRMYVGSSSVSYPTPGDQPNLIFVPAYDQAIMLEIFETVARNLTSGAKAVIVFDNLSELVLLRGINNSYKFLKMAIEILVESTTTLSSLFLLISGAQETRTLNLMRGLFSRHLVFNRSGLRITR